MKRPKWYRQYLLAAGSTILTLGCILVVRTFLEHRSIAGLVLGAVFILYGLFRLKRRRSIPIQA